jgi:hypothetical protein
LPLEIAECEISACKYFLARNNASQVITINAKSFKRPRRSPLELTLDVLFIHFFVFPRIDAALESRRKEMKRENSPAKAGPLDARNAHKSSETFTKNRSRDKAKLLVFGAQPATICADPVSPLMSSQMKIIAMRRSINYHKHLLPDA